MTVLAVLKVSVFTVSETSMPGHAHVPKIINTIATE